MPLASVRRYNTGVTIKVLPVDIAELMFPGTSFERHGNVKSPAGGYRTANSGHGDARNILKGDIRSRLWYEHEALVEAE